MSVSGERSPDPGSVSTGGSQGVAPHLGRVDTAASDPGYRWRGSQPRGGAGPAPCPPPSPGGRISYSR